jgi:hypothetical protein
MTSSTYGAENAKLHRATEILMSASHRGPRPPTVALIAYFDRHRDR